MRTFGWIYINEMIASRTEVEPRLVGVAALEEKLVTVIQGKFAAWIAPTALYELTGTLIRRLIDS
jgi:hypothetical protein